MTFAIYTLANDVTLSWLHGLVGSLKAVRTKLPIKVIPYDSRTERLEDAISDWVKDGLDVSLVSSADFETLDQLGLEIMPESGFATHIFRKFHAFWAEEDYVAYIDADIIVGEDPEVWLKAYYESAREDVIGLDDDIEYVFPKGEIYNTFTSEKRAAVNAGFFVTKSRLVTLADLQDVACSCRQHSDSFIKAFGDQSFWNYFLWRCGVSVELMSCLNPRYSDSGWAPRNAKPVHGGFRITGEDGGTSLQTMLHWAGIKFSPTMGNWHLLLRAAIPGMRYSVRIRFLWAFMLRSPIVFLKLVPKWMLSNAVRTGSFISSLEKDLLDN